MNISEKKSRPELAAFFKKNSIPTAQNFRDFIDATLNQREDGIFKPDGDPLCIQAADKTHKPVLNFYENFADSKVSWFLALQHVNKNGAHRGFIIGNPSDDATVSAEPRFFIKMENGNVGIGTATPSYRLEVAGSLGAQSADFKGALKADSTATIKGTLTAASHVIIGGELQSSTAAGLTIAVDKTSVRELSAARIINAQQGILVTGAAATIGTKEAPQSLTVHGEIIGQKGLKVEGGTTSVGKLSASDLINAGGGLDVTGALKLGGYEARKFVNAISSTAPSADAIPTEMAVREYVTQQTSSIKLSPTDDIKTGKDTDVTTRKAVKTFVDSAIPLGAILMWSGSDIPTGWALCDGTNGTPNLTDRFVLGKSATRPIGMKDGAETVTLSLDEIPSHTHSASLELKVREGAVNSSAKEYGIQKDNVSDTSRDATITRSPTIGSAGGGKAHNNMPPYYVLAFIMRKS